MTIPPPRKSLPPPPLPKGQFVKVVSDPNGGFKIVTAHFGSIVGPRLDKGKCATYPERSQRLSLDEAKKAFGEWEKFCEAQQHERTSKSKTVGNQANGQGETLFNSTDGRS